MEEIEKMKIYEGLMPVKFIGGSHYILLDKRIKSFLEVNDGIVLKGKLANVELKDVKCPKCTYKFTDYQQADVHDCPSCGIEFYPHNTLTSINDSEVEMTNVTEGNKHKKEENIFKK